MSLTVKCSFVGQYHTKYQRNNKRCGFKNLRCFPSCGPKGVHHEQGFCGAPICVDISIDTLMKNKEYDINNLKAWGEFVVFEKEVRFPIGSKFSKQDINDLLRTDQQRTNPLFESEKNAVNLKNTTRFSFQSNKMGYHYGWTGNKHVSELQHAFCVYLCQEKQQKNGIGMLECIGVFHSSPFTIFCRRRHKTVPVEERNQLALPREPYVLKHMLSENGEVIEKYDLGHTTPFIAQNEKISSSSFKKNNEYVEMMTMRIVIGLRRIWFT